MLRTLPFVAAKKLILPSAQVRLTVDKMDDEELLSVGQVGAKHLQLACANYPLLSIKTNNIPA